MHKTSKYLLLIIFVAATWGLKAQNQRDTLRREVEVTKAFTPTVSDANKLNSMPELDETEHQKPAFNYSITSQPLFSSFLVAPLKAATIENEPHVQKGYGLVRAGLGNYYKPYGEIFFNNLNSKNSVFGIHASHLSSFSKISLEGGDKVDAPFMNNQLELFVKNSIRNSILSVDADLKHDAFNYYGYPINPVPYPLLEENQQINYFGAKQSFTKGGFHINLDNPGAEMDEQEVSFDFDYHYFGTKTDQREHYMNFTANYRQPLVSGVGLIEGGVEYTNASQIYLPNDTVLGKKSATILFAKPAWYIGDKKANATLGVNTWFVMQSDMDTEARISPNVKANWSPVEEIITLFAGIDGNFINNYYSKIAYENPFVNPLQNVKNTHQRIRFYGGFDGKLSKKTAFKVSGEFVVINDQPLYYLNENYYLTPLINPNPLIVDNTFAVLYDDMNRTKLNAEIYHASSDKLDLLLSANYYSYKMKEQTEAWNLPQWDATITIGYKITEQFTVNADIFMMGERKALIVENPDPSVAYPANVLPPHAIYHTNNLDPMFDINLKANYQLTNKFGLFAQLNNLGFQGYERWLGYPTQSFNFLAGVSYAF